MRASAAAGGGERHAGRALDMVRTCVVARWSASIETDALRYLQKQKLIVNMIRLSLVNATARHAAPAYGWLYR